MTNILVIRFSSVGDIVLTEPIVRTLKSSFPKATMSFLTKERFQPVLEMFAHIDHSYGWRDDQDAGELLASLKKKKFDLVIDLHNNIRSARVRTVLSARAMKARKEWFRRVAAVKFNAVGGKPSHALERYFSALKGLHVSTESKTPKLKVPVHYLDWWRKMIITRKLTSDYYVIAAGATHATKRAPEQLWVDLDRKIWRGHSLAPLLVGAPSEREYLSALTRQFDTPVADIITEESICRAAAVIKTARFVVSNDSGLAHLAAAVGTPVVALFGPTHPVLGFAPLGEHADHYTVDEYCSPCSLHGDRKCFREERLCFTRMRIDTIIEKIDRLVQS